MLQRPMQQTAETALTNDVDFEPAKMHAVRI